MAASLSMDNDDESPTISDINVTPLVDIMLVLLIIMMVAAPLIASNPAFKANLPTAKNASSVSSKSQAVIVVKSTTKPYQIYLGEKPVSDEELQQETKAILAKNANEPFSVQGDTDLSYGKVIHVMDLLRGAGVPAFAISTSTPKENP